MLNNKKIREKIFIFLVWSLTGGAGTDNFGISAH
jgi:hypothetical protein